MKQLTSNFVNMAVSLTVVCVLAAFLLSYFVFLTNDKIIASEAQKQSAAVTEVLPFDSAEIKSEKVLVGVDSLTVYRAYIKNKEVGVAVESFSNDGFNGEIKVMIGFDKDRNILNYSVIDQKETPGLGTKMVNWFKPQVDFKRSLVEKIFAFQMMQKERQSSIIGRNSSIPLKVKKDGGEIDAITAATISSRAFLNAVNRAFNVVNIESNGWDATSSASTPHHKKEIEEHEYSSNDTDVISAATAAHYPDADTIQESGAIHDEKGDFGMTEEHGEYDATSSASVVVSEEVDCNEKKRKRGRDGNE